MKILLVGLSRNMTETIRELAENEGIKALYVYDYMEALLEVKKGVYEGIIVDAFLREAWNQGVGVTNPWGLLLQDRAASEGIPCVIVIKQGTSNQSDNNSRKRWVEAYFRQLGKTMPPTAWVRQDGGNKRDHTRIYQFLRGEMRFREEKITTGHPAKTL